MNWGGWAGALDRQVQRRAQLLAIVEPDIGDKDDMAIGHEAGGGIGQSRRDSRCFLEFGRALGRRAASGAMHCTRVRSA